MRLPCRPILASVVFVSLCSVGATRAEDVTKVTALAEAPASLAPHRAVYDLTLGDTRGSSSVEAIRGRIVYDFSGSQCKGYALKFRQVTEISASGGSSNMSDLRSSTLEAVDGKSFKFSSENYVNDELDTAIDGLATRTDTGAVEVKLKKPKSTSFDLPQGSLFPTTQVRAILAAAQEGVPVYESRVYDGSDGGEKTYSTLAVIGHQLAQDKPADGAAVGRKELTGVSRWPVTISYFDPTKSKGGEQTPVYSLSFDLYANGISSNLRLDYGDFSLKGEMKSLEFLPQDACP